MIRMQVERPGMFSLLQDLGRTGHQKLGVAVNGPMDVWSHRLANAIVGNDDDAAVLECTVSGPRLRFSDDVVLALCGAAMKATVAGRAVPFDTAICLRRGAVLDIGERVAGARLSIAVRGGFGVPVVLGSRGTNTRAGFGGFQGRALRAGDQVPVATATHLPRLALERCAVQSGLPFVAAHCVDHHMPAAAGEDTVRVIAGPHWTAFTLDAQQALTGQPFTLSPQSDRMGLRLKGPMLALAQPLEVVSEATVFGTVQVPPDGAPIVLMADRESAGGYPKIGYVASADLPRLAQRLPGDAVRFARIGQDEAEALWRDFETRLAQARAAAAAALV